MFLFLRKLIAMSNEINYTFSMIKAVLFDLDGTLVQLPDFDKRVFIEYAKVGIKHGYDGKEFQNAVMQGLIAMLGNQTDKTNRQVFYETFSQYIPSDENKIEQAFDEFYNGELNNFKQDLTIKINLAPKIKELREAGLKIVLATSPVFPISAIITRLAWVGLSLDDFYFVTNYENITRSKRFTEFITHILKKLNEKIFLINLRLAENFAVKNA